MSAAKTVKKPVRIALLGAKGRMGSAITRLCEGTFAGKATVTLPVDREMGPDVLLKTDRYDVIVDVALPEACERAAKALLGAKLKNLPPLVSGSTGWKPASEKTLTTYATRGAVLRATNFSPAIHIFGQMLEEFAPKLAALGYEVALTDVHHNQKRDAPSGTAKTLISKIEAGGLTPQVNAIRAGTVVGTHTVAFYGPEDILEIRHEALNRDLFARGAILAALWAAKRPGDARGFYSMADVFSG